MQTRVRRWGDDLLIRIPKAFAKEMGLKENALVEITSVEGGLLVKSKARRRSKYTLEELLAGIRDENIHEEIDLGPPQGKERF